MRSMISVLVFGTFVAMVASSTTMMMMMSTTHKPHHSTREPSEQGSLSFYYDHTSDYLILKTSGYCYFMKLNVAEQTMVHNPDGLRRLEAQAIHMMTSATHTAMRGGDHAHVSRYVYGRLCPNAHLIKLVQ